MDVARFTAATAEWSPDQRKAMVDYWSAEAVRKKIKTTYADATDLAAALDPKYVVTPALKLVAGHIETVLTRPRHNLLVTWPPQEGKAILDSVEVPTPGGWRKHGELANGDWVFHPSGKPIRVLAKHPDCVIDRRVWLSDHTHVDVHRFHEWTVWDRSSRTYRTIETADLERVKLSQGTPGMRGHRYRFQLPLRGPIVLPSANLPLDPYTLGVWLGDGTASEPCITHHADETYKLPYQLARQHVHAVTGCIRSCYVGLRADLQAAGVWRAKHIPPTYLRASIAQRRALLAGLIDTDGCVSGTQTSFDNTDEQLVRDTAELIRSLGYRAHVHKPTPACMSSSGIAGKKDMWRVTFSPHDQAPARLARKVAKWRPAIRKRIAVTRIEKLDLPGTGNCITVDSEDGLYLAGPGWTPTHNSFLCAVYAPLRALQHNPNCRVILATYADALAAEHSRVCRERIDQHGSGVIDQLTGVMMDDKLGYRLAPGSNQVGVWKIAGARGGMIAVGLGSSITGRPADLLIVDDPFKNMMEADSQNHRRKVAEWFASVAMTRLSPQASIVLIQTRWHPDDLAGQIISGEGLSDPRFKTWKHVNVPAIAEAGIPDALNREPGVPMVSARGRTKEDFEATRRAVGERVWYALYQGSPRNPAGGLFARAWFDPHADEPAEQVAAIVGVDPADTGEHDDTGIIGGVLTGQGTVVLTEDWSGQFTSDVWARRAVTLALQMGAREIAMEAYSTATTYEQVLKRAYRAIHTDAVAKYRAGAELSMVETRALPEFPPFTIYKWRAGARVDAIGRSALLRQALETRRCRTVEHRLAVFEDQACDWQAGQHQPDRVAAAIITHDRLAALGGGQMTVATPINERPDPLTRLRNIDAAPTMLARRLGQR